MKHNSIHSKNLLVFNCHEPWVHQLGILGFNLDIIVGLSGRYQSEWDSRMRPVPPCSRIINLQEAKTASKKYDCIITNNLTDLLDVKHRTEPKILILHSTLEGRDRNHLAKLSSDEMKAILQKYIDLANIHVVAISRLKGSSWGQIGDIVPISINAGEYLPYKGNIAKGLRISNFINQREKILLWDFHKVAFNRIPVRLVGHNPSMNNIVASRDWDDLKKILQEHRFYIHTADPIMEDGYNLATLEAMASGMPVIGNKNPSSPIIHGVNGFLSDDPIELSNYAKKLIGDQDLAIQMGIEAKKTVSTNFSHQNFKEAFLKSIEFACRKVAH